MAEAVIEGNSKSSQPAPWRLPNLDSQAPKTHGAFAEDFMVLLPIPRQRGVLQ